MSENIFQRMKERWSSELVSRQEAFKFSGGVVSAKTLANADSMGKGPKQRMKFGRVVAYPVDALCEWLESRITQKREVEA